MSITILLFVFLPLSWATGMNYLVSFPPCREYFTLRDSNKFRGFHRNFTNLSALPVDECHNTCYITNRTGGIVRFYTLFRQTTCRFYLQYLTIIKQRGVMTYDDAHYFQREFV